MDKKSDQVPRDAPLRLDVALRLAFPAGGLTVKGLRREIARGRLEAELIANKHFTSLAAIERMRERCKVVAKTPNTEDALTVRDIRPDVREGESESALQRLATKMRANLRAKRQREREKNK